MLTPIHVLCDCYTKIFRGLNVFQSLLMPTPGVHRIKQGLDLRLDRLKLLVDCAQRAMSSTCGWTLVSHSNRVCVIASCVGPCEFHDDQICLLVPPIHRTIQVADDIVPKLNQLGLTIPPTSEPMLTFWNIVPGRRNFEILKKKNQFLLCSKNTFSRQNTLE